MPAGKPLLVTPITVALMVTRDVEEVSGWTSTWYSATKSRQASAGADLAPCANPHPTAEAVLLRSMLGVMILPV